MPMQRNVLGSDRNHRTGQTGVTGQRSNQLNYVPNREHCRFHDVAYLCSRAPRDPFCRTGNEGEAVADVILLAKHAQHVVLIHFPIALFISGVAFDLLSRGKRDSQLASAAYRRIECQCVPWLEHEMLHRSEPDWTFARTRTHSVHSYYNGFLLRSGSASVPTRVRFLHDQRRSTGAGGRDGYWQSQTPSSRFAEDS